MYFFGMNRKVKLMLNNWTEYLHVYTGHSSEFTKSLLNTNAYFLALWHMSWMASSCQITVYMIILPLANLIRVSFWTLKELSIVGFTKVSLISYMVKTLWSKPSGPRLLITTVMKIMLHIRSVLSYVFKPYYTMKLKRY